MYKRGPDRSKPDSGGTTSIRARQAGKLVTDCSRVSYLILLRGVDGRGLVGV